MVGPIGVKKPGALPPDLQEFLQDTGGARVHHCVFWLVRGKNHPQRKD